MQPDWRRLTRVTFSFLIAVWVLVGQVAKDQEGRRRLKPPRAAPASRSSRCARCRCQTVRN